MHNTSFRNQLKLFRPGISCVFREGMNDRLCAKLNLPAKQVVHAVMRIREMPWL